MASAEDETLENLDEKEVFLRCMADGKIPENRREELFVTFVEALKSLSEDDVMKE